MIQCSFGDTVLATAFGGGEGMTDQVQQVHVLASVRFMVF